jgi:hypothetical protein
MAPPFMMNSSSIPTSMEKISSSTASREKRGQWLTKSKTKFILKTAFALALVVACCVAVAVIVPHLKKGVKKTSAVYQSTHHNLKKNDTYGNNSNLFVYKIFLDGESMLKSTGFKTGLEKDALQICDLSPESRNELGKSTWSLLHIMASTYPVNPTPEIVQDHRIFFQLLPRLYPCPDCRAHMRKMFNELPPQLENREKFMNWLCEAHNRVNLRLGKPIFDCTKLDERWDCGCNIVPGQGTNVPNASAQNEKIPREKDPKNSRSSKAKKEDKKDKKSRSSKATRTDHKSLIDTDNIDRKSSMFGGHAPLVNMDASKVSKNEN